VKLCIAARIALVFCGAGVAMPVLAQAPVALDSAVFVERLTANNVRSLEPASRLNRGDRVVTVLSWQRLGRPSGTNGFTRAIAYQASAHDSEEVSVDGGHSWGTIGSLRYGSRLATPEDVTHVRWRLPASAGSGRIAYSGIVR
jgi:hypothetical protein